MNIRYRLLLLITPLIVLPLLFVSLLALYLFEQLGPTDSVRIYEFASLVVTFLTMAAVIWILFSATNSITQPIVKLTLEAEKVSRGDSAAMSIGTFDTAELTRLSDAIRHMQAELMRHQEMLAEQAAHAAAGQVAAHVAHDLAGPLSSMQTALGYFRQLRVADSRTPDYVNLLELSTTRLKAVSKELLDLHKGEEPRKVLFSLHKLLDELVGEYQSNADYGAVKFVKRYTSQAISIYADRGKIQRVFGNLVKNAIEAMDKVGRLSVTVRSDGPNAVVELEDDGSGMPPEILRRVMSDGMTYGKSGGNGIGMKVVRATVEEHGGGITARSEVGIGTVFTVRLPLPESVLVKEVAKEDGIVESFEVVLLPNEPLLVVDDDVEMLEQWRLEMERLGRTTLSCSSHEDFVEKGIGSRLTQSAVVDYHFENSELNGIQVIRKLKESGFKRLYLCTAEYWKPSVRQEAGALGVRICPKPLPRVVVQTSPNVLVIDDDAAIRMCWKVQKEEFGIGDLQMFASMEECENKRLDYGQIDLAFIDKHIEGSGWKLDQMIAHLKTNGVRKVWVASGDTIEDLQNDPACATADGIVKGKMPESLDPYLNS